MITSFKLTQNLCRKHNLPQAFLCLNKLCTTHSLLCCNCIKKDHLHLQYVHSIKNFIQYFSQFLPKAKQRYQEDRCEMNISGIIKAKKQEIQQLHLELVQTIIKKLSDQKRIICRNFDLMEKQYREKQNLLKKNQQKRMMILNCLLPYSQQTELLEVKLKTSSRVAITELKQNLIDLQNLTNTFDKNNYLSLESSAINEANLKLQGTFFKNINKFLKQQTTLIKVPLPDKPYSLTYRRFGVTQHIRPGSNAQKRSQSFDSDSTKTNSQKTA